MSVTCNPKTGRDTVRIALLTGAALIIGACAGDARSTSPASPVIPDINAYASMANDAPPGASASALATAAAIGRGVNFGNMLEAPTEGAWGLTVTDDFIAKAAAAGFASVRLPVRWSSHASVQPPFTIDPVFLARVESVVDKLLAKGVTVVLNMHHYRQLDGDGLDAGEIAVAQAAVDVRFLMLWDWNSASDLRLLKVPNDANLIATIHNYAPFSFTHQGAEWVTPVLPIGVTCCSVSQQSEMTAPLDVART